LSFGDTFDLSLYFKIGWTRVRTQILMKQKRYGPHSQNGKENIMKKKKKPLFVVDVETTIV